MRDYLQEIIFIIAIVLLTIAFVLGVYFGVNEAGIKLDEKLWNGGHCDVYSASGYGVINKTKYCPNCGARMVEPQERKYETLNT